MPKGATWPITAFLSLPCNDVIKSWRLAQYQLVIHCCSVLEKSLIIFCQRECSLFTVAPRTRSCLRNGSSPWHICNYQSRTLPDALKSIGWQPPSSSCLFLLRGTLNLVSFPKKARVWVSTKVNTFPLEKKKVDLVIEPRHLHSASLNSAN